MGFFFQKKINPGDQVFFLMSSIASTLLGIIRGIEKSGNVQSLVLMKRFLFFHYGPDKCST
jgi:hypothetical protein